MSYNIFAELVNRMGVEPAPGRDSTPDDVFDAHCIIEDIAWRNGAYFVLSECFTDRSSRNILSKFSEIDFSSPDRRDKVREVIKKLFSE